MEKKKLKLGDYRLEEIVLDSRQSHPSSGYPGSITLDACIGMRDSAKAMVKELPEEAYDINEYLFAEEYTECVYFVIHINIKRYYTPEEIDSHNNEIKESNKQKRLKKKNEELAELARLQAKYKKQIPV